MRLSYSPHAVLSRNVLRLSFVILSQHLLPWCKLWCPEICPRSTSINKCRAPRVNDASLSARHCITECIYSISPGTKVWGSSAGHRSLQIREASFSKMATQHSCCRRLLCLLCATQKAATKDGFEIIDTRCRSRLLEHIYRHSYHLLNSPF